MKNKKRMISIVLTCFILVSIWSIYFSQYTQRVTADISTTGITDELVSGHVYSQEITPENSNVNAIELYFATYNRKNISNVKVELLYDGTVIQSWTLQTEKLQDNQYYQFQLNKKLTANQTYTIQITSDADEENAVTLYQNNLGEYNGYSVDGTEVENTSICYKLQYNARGWNRYTLLFFLISIIIVAVSFFVYHTDMKIERKFLVVWLMLGVLYLVSNPLFNIPDEIGHFFRAYEISEGYIVSDTTNQGTEVGRELPLNVNYTKYSASWDSFWDYSGTTETSDNTFLSFWNISLYAPVSYIPQSTGILIARTFTDNIAIIAYMGRIFNFICISIVLYFAIKLAPIGKEVLFFIALLPMNIHESVTLAPDGMVVALSAFMIAYVMYLYYAYKDKMKAWHYIILYVLAIMISLYKIVYLPFCLIYFLIPNERFGGMKKKYIHAGIIAACVVLTSIGWLKLCSGFLIKEGTDSNAQLLYVLKHPINYYIIVLRTYLKNGLNYIQGMVGQYLATLSVEISGVFVVIYCAILYRKSHAGIITDWKDKKTVTRKVIFAAVVIIITLLISLSLYMQWTLLYANVIDGIQGRYFIALLFPLYFVLTKDRYDVNKSESVGFYSFSAVLIINIASCMGLLFAAL